MHWTPYGRPSEAETHCVRDPGITLSTRPNIPALDCPYVGTPDLYHPTEGNVEKIAGSGPEFRGYPPFAMRVALFIT